MFLSVYGVFYVSNYLFEQKEKAVEGGVRPCSTLFIANLGPNCTEDELRQVLSRYVAQFLKKFNFLTLYGRGFL